MWRIEFYTQADALGPQAWNPYTTSEGVIVEHPFLRAMQYARAVRERAKMDLIRMPHRLYNVRTGQTVLL